MKYTLEINQSLDKVASVFYQQESMKEYLDCLQSFEPMRGEVGATGSTAKSVSLMGKRKVEMTETIVENNLPDLFSLTYEAKGVWNLVENSFEAIDETTTKWSMFSEFKCGGMIKIMAYLAPGMFKKESLKYMKQFKAFVEGA